jgi:predicted amidohydrolase
MKLGVRVAISQQKMQWEIDANVLAIQAALETASGHGADLVLFPEMTLVGLHTKIREILVREKLEEALRLVSAACRTHQVGAAVGAPVWLGQDRPQNSVVTLDRKGAVVATSSKLRLMPPGEPIVFESAVERPVFEWGGVTHGVVICREILDRNELAEELGGRASVILWPGTMARGPMQLNNPEDYAVCASQLAEQQGAWVLHSNWAQHVDAPDLPFTGKSMVISPLGSIVLEAPPRETGLLLSWKTSMDEAWIPAAF